MRNDSAFTTTNSRILIGALALILGLVVLLATSWGWWGLFVGGVIAWIVVFEGDSYHLFILPHRLWIILLGVIGYFVYGLLVSNIAERIGFEWVANSAVENLSDII
ncbi:hypothetical protein VXN63_10500 [Marinilactibacillus sp. XAAS-LB27]|uniref:hypothetical protein n=1 Tax=Marinilactibacillus sp. XAAS-LB27 TaxID=3114538 RepID=UPI002E1985D6|nr:hypothetical protein [Marinilactibacillus sp. XAAS-LB27]